MKLKTLRGFGKRLRDLRYEREMTQDQLAAKLGYKSFSSIQKWEEGNSTPPYSTLCKIAELFGVSVAYLMDGQETFYDYKDESDNRIIKTDTSAETVNTVLREAELLQNYRDLNDDGKEHLLQESRVLRSMPQFQKPL